MLLSTTYYRPNYPVFPVYAKNVDEQNGYSTPLFYPSTVSGFTRLRSEI